jgi:hypothetical protein
LLNNIKGVVDTVKKAQQDAEIKNAQTAVPIESKRTVTESSVAKDVPTKNETPKVIESSQEVSAANSPTVTNEKQDIEVSKAAYEGENTIYRFRTDASISAAYNRCVIGEIALRTKEISKAEVDANNADTIVEQKRLRESVKEARRTINYFGHGMCVYRIYFGFVMLEQGDVLATSITTHK